MPVIDEEYRTQCAADSQSSKGMFQLIQRKGSTRHLMALLNTDGSVAKAWPVQPVDGEGKLTSGNGGENCVGNPMYGPLLAGKAEPVNLQFGNFGISAWPSDTGGTSYAGSIDDSRADTETGSRYFSSCCSSPRVSDGPAKELLTTIIVDELATPGLKMILSFSIPDPRSTKLLTTITVDELATPGLKTILSFSIPDQRFAKVEAQYLHDYAGINASIGLTVNPIVNFSGVLGTNAVAVGVDVSLDTATGNFTKYNAGLNITNADLVASLTLNNKGDSLSTSYYHLVSPLSSTAVVAELTHSFSSNDNVLTFGTQYELNPLTSVRHTSTTTVRLVPSSSISGSPSLLSPSL